MVPKVSIVVPTYNSGRFLEKCLESIVRQSYKNIEIVVVDKFSQDQTQEIAARFTEHVFETGPERSAQRNYGLKKTTGEYVFFVDSDMELSKDVVREAVDVCKNDSVKGIVIPEESFGDGFWAQCKKLERSFYVGVPWMEAARFFPKKVVMEVGGYDEGGVGAEDYDMPQRIESIYGKSCFQSIRSFIYHNELHTTLWSTCKKRFYYGQNFARYTSVHANKEKAKKQASLLDRYELFFSDRKKLFAQPFLGWGMLLMKTCEFVCGGVGFFVGKFK